MIHTPVAAEITAEDIKSRGNIEAEAKTTGQTSVEMEALTGVSVAALTIYDYAQGGR